MKNHPDIKKILESFPGIKIHSITDIGETSDELINKNGLYNRLWNVQTGQSFDLA